MPLPIMEEMKTMLNMRNQKYDWIILSSSATTESFVVVVVAVVVVVLLKIEGAAVDSDIFLFDGLNRF